VEGEIYQFVRMQKENGAFVEKGPVGFFYD